MPKKPSVMPKEPYILFKEPCIMPRLSRLCLESLSKKKKESSSQGRKEAAGHEYRVGVKCCCMRTQHLTTHWRGANIHVYVYVHICVFLCVYVYICVYTYICTCVYVCIKVDRKKPLLPGGFSIYYVPWSRAVCKRFHDEIRRSPLLTLSFDTLFRNSLSTLSSSMSVLTLAFDTLVETERHSLKKLSDNLFCHSFLTLSSSMSGVTLAFDTRFWPARWNRETLFKEIVWYSGFETLFWHSFRQCRFWHSLLTLSLKPRETLYRDCLTLFVCYHVWMKSVGQSL